MTKGLKVTGIVLGVLVVILAGLALAAKMLITPERVKQTVIPLVEKKLNRQLQLGEVEVSILSGIVLNDLAISDREPGAPFLQARQAKLSYQFWPLLQKRIVVDEIALDSLQLKVVRLPDGTFNFSDMIQKKAPEAAPPAAKDVSLLVSKVSLDDGVLRYEDRSGKGGTTVVHTVSDIDFSATDIAPNQTFPFTLEGRIPGAAFEMEGKITEAEGKPGIDAVLRVPQGDLKQLVGALPPAVRAKAQGYAPTGKIGAELHLAGPFAAAKQLLQKGELKLDGVQLNAAGQRPALTGTFHLKKEALSSDDLTVRLGEDQLKVTLSVANLLSKPLVLKSTVRGDRLNLDTLLSKKGAAPAQPPAREGARKEPAAKELPLQASGTVQLGEAVVKGLKVGNLLLRYRLAGNVLTVDELKGKLAEGSFAATLRASNLLSKPLVLQSNVRVDRLNLDTLLGKKGAAPSQPAQPAAGAKKEPGPLNLPLQASGTVQVGETAIKGLKVADLLLRYRLGGNVLTIEELKGKMAGGSFAKSARLDLGRKGFPFSGKVALRGVQAEPVLQAFAPKATGRITGTLEMNAELSAPSIAGDTMMKNAAGGGDFNVTGGKITGSALLQDMSRYLQINELRELPFSTFAGKFQLAGGILKLDSSIVGKDVQVTPTGTVGAVDKALDMSLATRLSPRLTEKITRGHLGRYIADEKGWGVVPLRAKGTLAAPKVGIDPTAAGEKLKSQAKEKIERTIQEKILKKKPGEEPRPEQELLEKGLRGIFGR